VLAVDLLSKQKTSKKKSVTKLVNVHVYRYEYQWMVRFF
jgi:hypothetical protein